MTPAALVIILHGMVNCEPYIRSDLIPDGAEVYCITPDRAPLTSPRPQARPTREENQ
jgi:hypothetical protein